MFRRAKKILIWVCLAAPLFGQKAGTHSTALPDPFAPYARTCPLRPAPAARRKLQSVRAVWMQPNKAESLGLFFAACLCLVMLELKVHGRKTGKESRLAESLAGALRTGVLGSAEPARSAIPVCRIWKEPDEPAEPPPEPEQMVSRYHLLGYDFGESPDTGEAEVLSTRVLHPRAKPSRQPLFLLEAAAGDDPGKRIHDLDLAERRA